MCLFLQHENCSEFLTYLKFTKFLLCTPKYFCVYETHTAVKHNVFRYKFILDGAGIESPWR